MAPIQKPGRSFQDYCTPPEFLIALRKKLHIQDFAIDLAAADGNAIVPAYYKEADNALLQPWKSWGWAFCNPPYAHLAPWVKKAWNECQKNAWITMLIPAGVGTNWWRDWVHYKCMVLFLNGRLTFVGEVAPYPKDQAILLYSTAGMCGYEIWNWRTE